MSLLGLSVLGARPGCQPGRRAAILRDPAGLYMSRQSDQLRRFREDHCVGQGEGSNAMTDHEIGTREEWQAARAGLLSWEKELTQMSDELAAQRRELP